MVNPIDANRWIDPSPRLSASRHRCPPAPASARPRHFLQARHGYTKRRKTPTHRTRSANSDSTPHPGRGGRGVHRTRPGDLTSKSTSAQWVIRFDNATAPCRRSTRWPPCRSTRGAGSSGGTRAIRSCHTVRSAMPDAGHGRHGSIVIARSDRMARGWRLCGSTSIGRRRTNATRPTAGSPFPLGSAPHRGSRGAAAPVGTGLARR